YLEANQVRFLVAIQREGVLYDGVFAEGMAIDTLHSIPGDSLLTSSDHTLMERLWRGIGTGEVILRSLSLSREEYAQHLESVSDWNGNYEDPVCVNTVRNYLPSMLWVVEFSIPELFPATLRKLG
ncbi:hypothetical protein RZS08_34840, partial [Arthrospira platensis SPKY1]|nr:hypothetical protein [Arthrospira platensis SPKY1]